MFGFRRNNPGVEPLPSGNLARKVKIIRPAIGREKAGAGLRSGQAEINFPADYGHYERITLYRFLRENIPIVNGAIWVWARLCAGPMEFTVRGDDSTRNAGALKLGKLLIFGTMVRQRVPDWCGHRMGWTG